jgi:tRNA(fMet)-specific endonuclease VapC
MDRALLDTDILSEVMRGKDVRVVEHASLYIQTYGRFTISAVTVAEVVKGFERLQRQADIARFMTNVRIMEVLSLTGQAAIIAGRIYGTLERSGLPIGRMDPLIAAIALSNNLPLVTGNVLHYERLRSLGFNLRIENWRE